MQVHGTPPTIVARLDLIHVYALNDLLDQVVRLPSPNVAIARCEALACLLSCLIPASVALSGSEKMWPK